MGGCASTQKSSGRAVQKHDNRHKGKVTIISPPFGKKQKEVDEVFMCFLASKQTCLANPPNMSLVVERYRNSVNQAAGKDAEGSASVVKLKNEEAPKV